MSWKLMSWKECCRCFHRSPRREMWGDACDAAEEQGFTNFSTVFWLENDPNRPEDWSPHKPGTISVYTTFCELCKKITVEEGFQILKGFCLSHNYRHHGGAGSTHNLTYKCKSGDYFTSTYFCAVCRREIVIDFRQEHHDAQYKSGYTSIGLYNGIGSVMFCSCECRKKTTIKELKYIQQYAKRENEKMWKEAFPSNYE